MQALEAPRRPARLRSPAVRPGERRRIGRRLRRRLDPDRLHPAGRHTGRARRPPRGSRCQTMDYLRQFADAGVAIIVVAALARSKDAKGRSSYTDGLSLASFRETSELEYGADDAFILAPADDAKSEGEASSRVVLKHLKSRHGETRDIVLTFDRQAPAVHSGRARRTKNASRQRKAPGGSSRYSGTRPDRLKTTARLTGEHQREADRQAEDDEASFSASLRDAERLRRYRHGRPEPGRAGGLAHPLPRHEARRDRPSIARRPGSARGHGSTNGKPSGRPTGSPQDASGYPTRGVESRTFGLSRLPVSDGVNISTVRAGAYSTVGILLPTL